MLAELPDDSRAMHEEPFGPLALINPVTSLDDAIEKANALPFGLAAYAFTRSPQQCGSAAPKASKSEIYRSTTWSRRSRRHLGSVKESGYGREGGTEGLSHYHS